MGDRGALEQRREGNRPHVSETLTHGGGKEKRADSETSPARLRASTSVRLAILNGSSVRPDGRTKGKKGRYKVRLSYFWNVVMRARPCPPLDTEE